MLNVALLGAGRIGQVHAVNIAAHAASRLSCIVDAHAETAEKLAIQYGTQSVSIDAAFADADIDAVLIATSTDTHAGLIERAVASGKAVLCEKPVDLSLERASQCLSNTRGSDVPVMVGLNRRFDPHFNEMKKSLDAGAIGAGELLSITSFDPAPPPIDYIKVSGGLFRDMMIHDIDVACWMFGSMPTTVSANGACLVDPAIGEAGDVDTAVVTLQWEDGRIAVIRNSRRAAYGYDQRIELLGSKGLLSANNVLEHTVTTTTTLGTVTAKPEHFFLERYSKAYVAEWAAFVDTVSAETAPPVTLKDGVNALAIAEAATLSFQTGQRVVMDGLIPTTIGRPVSS